MEVLYDAVSVGFSGDSLPRPLDATIRGDTLFVYVLGSLDPDVVLLTCSPPEFGIQVDVRAVLVPEGTVAARVTTISLSELSPQTAAALRTAGEARALMRPTLI